MSNDGADAVLLLSFGGPEGPDEVMPFLRNVVQGRDVPDERLAEVAKQYEPFGGVSPINSQNRALANELEKRLSERGHPLPVYFGNRNWYPMLPDTLRTMRSDGRTRAIVVTTSGYSSYSGCRQYRENLFDASMELQCDSVGTAPALEKARLWFDSPGFIEAMTDRVRDAMSKLGNESAPIVFTAHSIPIALAQSSGPPAQRGAYQQQLEFVATTIASNLDVGEFSVVYQSRSGPPRVPWLEPDINDHFRAIASRGVREVVVAPIGFASDHMEVLWDLDTAAKATADEVGIRFVRAETVGTHPSFVDALADTVIERLENTPNSERRSLSDWGPWPDNCAVDCCLGAGEKRPALCGQDEIHERDVAE